MSFDLSEEQLALTEHRIGARFPNSYRERMKRSNGGAVEIAEDAYELIPIRDSSDRKRLSRTASDVLSETRSFAEWTTWPDDAYAIGQNGTGDALVMFRKGSAIGPTVHIWRHEDGALEVIANDFSAVRDA